jgi:hypothetical protein
MPAVNHSAKLAARLVAVLAASAPLSALVGSRVFGGLAPERSPLPRIIFHEISTVRDHQHDSATATDAGVDETLMQFDIEAGTPSAARAVSDALAETLDGAAFPGPPADLQACFRDAGEFGQPLDYDTGNGVAAAHRYSVTYRILWRDSAS